LPRRGGWKVLGGLVELGGGKLGGEVGGDVGGEEVGALVEEEGKGKLEEREKFLSSSLSL